MQRNTGGDEPIDRLLRRTLRAPLPADVAPGSCIDAETMAAWTEGALTPAEAVRVETHLSACPRCQALVASVARTHPEVPAAEPLWQRWRLRWLVPIAAAATAVAIWIAVPTDRPANTEQEVVALREPATPATQPPPSASAQSSRPPLDTREGAGQVVGGVTAGRAVDLDARDQGAVSDRALAAEAASPSQPAATAPAERREMALQRQAAGPIEIISPDRANRWRIIAGTRVERLTTEGNAWEAVTIDSSSELTAGASPGRLVCWLVGRAGTVRLTVDGVRFEGVPFPETVDLVDVRASSAMSAVVIAIDGRQFRTADQGRTWTLVAP